MPVLCATGADGCAGSIAVTAPNGDKLGSVPFDLQENETAKLTLPTLPAGVKSVDLALTYQRGVGSTGTTLPSPALTDTCRPHVTPGYGLRCTVRTVCWKP